MRPNKAPGLSLRQFIGLWLVLFVAIVVFTFDAMAADDQATPMPSSLVAGDRTEPKLIFSPKPSYPRLARDNWGEGWVLLNFTVTAAGTVKDIIEVDGLGTPDFFNSAIRGLKRWRYEPARENGRRVDAPNHLVLVVYTFENMIPQGSGPSHSRDVFNSKFKQAQQLAKDGQRQQAITILEQSLAVDRLTFYDGVIASALLAELYETQDKRKALLHIRHATFRDAWYLGIQGRRIAFRLQLALEATNGHLRDALVTFERLKRVDPNIGPNDEAVKTVERINEALADPMPFSFEARLEPSLTSSALALWSHRLSRPTFAFADIRGRLDRFRLACSGQVVEAEVNDKLQWTVDQGWGDCSLFAFGAAGTTFQFIESR